MQVKRSNNVAFSYSMHFQDIEPQHVSVENVCSLMSFRFASKD